MDCDWLKPKSASRSNNNNQKPNQVEMEKRKEVLTEFLFWFFDSFVIDLVKVRFLPYVILLIDQRLI
jgi:hypothetical protein